MKTIKEFRDELESLRKEMFRQGTNVDVLLLASWVDRLVIAIEDVSPTLDIMAEELDVLASRTKKETKKPSEPVKAGKPEKPKKVPKKPAPKKAKKLLKKVSSKAKKPAKKAKKKPKKSKKKPAKKAKKRR